MARITVVVADSVVNTGVYDFSFLHYAGPDTYGNPWGALELTDGEGTINLFKAMQERDWSSPAYRWELALFTSSQGQLFGGGINFTEDGSALVQLLASVTGDIKEFTILTSAQVAPRLQDACEVLGVELVVYTVNAALATSRNPFPQ